MKLITSSSGQQMTWLRYAEGVIHQDTWGPWRGINIHALTGEGPKWERRTSQICTYEDSPENPSGKEQVPQGSWLITYGRREDFCVRLSGLARYFLSKEPSARFAAKLFKEFGPLGANSFHGPYKQEFATGELLADWLTCLVTLRWIRDAYPIAFAKDRIVDAMYDEVFEFSNQAPIWQPQPASGASDDSELMLFVKRRAHHPIAKRNGIPLYARSTGYLVKTPYRDEFKVRLPSLDDPRCVHENDLYIPDLKRKAIAQRVLREAISRELRVNTCNAVHLGRGNISLIPEPKNLQGALYLSLLMDFLAEPLPVKVCPNPRCQVKFIGRADAMSCGRAGCQKFVTKNGLGRKGRAASAVSDE